MNKRILIICDSNPYPVRDGISAAINSFVIRVKNSHEVYFLINGILFTYNSSNILQVNQDNFPFDSFDIYVSSPILPSIKYSFKLPKNAVKIAFLSDCYTNVLIVNIKLAIRFNYVNFSLIKQFFKIPIYYIIEFIIYNRYNYIVLQTPRDISIFKNLFFVESKKIIDLPNIINFSKEIPHRSVTQRSGMGWVASFEGSYLKIATVFFKKVMVDVLSTDHTNKLYFLGKGSKEFVDMLLEEHLQLRDQIIAEPFYPNIQDFYSLRKIIICPVFKNYGLINKVIESLAFGCITIGDKGAFNGIEGFISGKHGLVAESFEEFKMMINEHNKNSDNSIGLNAMRLVHNFNNEKFLPENFTKMMDI